MNQKRTGKYRKPMILTMLSLLLVILVVTTCGKYITQIALDAFSLDVQGKAIAYAIYTESDATLRFVRSTTAPMVGDAWNGVAITGVWTDFEDDYESEPVWYNGLWDIGFSPGSVEKVVFDTEIKPVSTQYWFGEMDSLKSIEGLDKLNTAQATNTSGMFDTCSSLTFLDLSNLDTSNVVIMDGMFYGCSALREVTLGKDFKFVGTYGYLPETNSGYWYTEDGTAYLPSEVHQTATETVTYYATSPVYLTEIRITTPAAKTTYNHGEQFDSSGMVVTAYYSDGSSKVIEDYVFTPGKNGSAWVVDTAGEELYTYNGRVYYKTNDGEALFTTVIYGQNEKWYVPLLISKNANAAAYSTAGDYVSVGGNAVNSLVYNGETWYYTTNGAAFPFNGVPESNPPFLTSYFEAPYFNNEAEATRALLETYFGNKVGEGQTAIEISYTENGVTKTTFQEITVTGVTYEDFTITSENRYMIGYTGAEGEQLDIPETFYDEASKTWYKVVAIGEGAFNYCLNLNSVRVPSTVTSLGDRAFAGCEYMTRIDLPETLTSIGSRAFLECFSLQAIDIPQSVTSIGAHAFSYCTSLTTVDIPGSVKNIGAYAFAYCNSVTNINISNGLTSIEDFTFFACSSLESIQIPYGVTLIGDSAFGDCYMLEEIDLPNSLTWIGERAFCSSGLTEIYLPDSLVEILDEAFMYCYNLRYVEIPESVTRIGYYAFSGCNELTYIEFLHDRNDPLHIGLSAFHVENPVKTTVSSINSVVSAYDWAGDNRDLGAAYAIYTESDATLRFVRSHTAPVVGEHWNGVRITSVYSGFETAYFEDETFVPWYWDCNPNVVKVVFENAIAPVDTTGWFADMENLTKIEGISLLNTSNITRMDGMFAYCTSLTLDCSGWDVSRVISHESFNNSAPGVIPPNWVN